MPRRIGRAEDEQAVVVAHVAIHLGEELIDERAAGTALQIIAIRSERVYFIEEEHRRCMSAREFEKLVQVLFGITEIEIENLVNADGEEVRLDLTCRRTQLSQSTAAEQIST